MACSSSVSAFVASASNSMIESAVFCFSCLNVSIFHLASAALDLSLNVVLNSFTKSSQFWILLSLSSLSSFFCVQISATPPLRWARIAVILSSVLLTLLLLKNNLIPLHQSSNFNQSLSNHPGSSTIFFGNPAQTFLLFAAAAGASATDISSVVVYLYSSEAFSMIFKDSSYSDSASISFVFLELVLVPHSFILHIFRFPTGNAILFHPQVCPTIPLLQGELVDALPNVIILSQSSDCTQAKT